VRVRLQTRAEGESVEFLLVGMALP
jgi:hypothetical protein